MQSPTGFSLFSRTSGIEVDFSKVLHRFGPKALETLSKSLCQFFVPDQQRCKSPLRNEWMIEAKNDDVIVDNVKRMPNLSGITDTCNVFQMSAVFMEKSDQLRGRLVSKTEDHPLVHVPFRRINGDSPKDRKSAGRHLFDRAKVALFQV